MTLVASVSFALLAPAIYGTENNSIGDTIAQEASGIDVSKFISRGIDFNKLKQALSPQTPDSNNLYSQVTKSGALGKYGIQLSTLKNLGYKGTVQQFLENPDLQEYCRDLQISKGFEEAVKAYGNDAKKIVEGIISYTYTGSARSWENLAIAAQRFNEEDVPTIAEFLQDQFKKYSDG